MKNPSPIPELFYQGALAEQDAADLVQWRRHLHAHPELSFREEGTARFIEQTLLAEGITDLKRCAKTGVIATIKGAHPGPVLAFRGDIDALPIAQSSDAPYKSQNDGVMHACGHDVHATLGLGMAVQLHRRRDELHGTIKCIFQPAEEASPEDEPIGAERMVVEGALEDPKVEAIFAFHCMPTLDAGKIGYTGGPVWARSDLVEIEVYGQKTHAAYPHSGIDAVVVASHIVVAMQTITSRSLDARSPCVLSIGQLVAGSSYNIIADEAKLTGILRTLSDKTSEQAKARLIELVEGVARGFGASAKVHFTPGARLTANHVGLEGRCVSALSAILGSERLVSHLPQMGAEDFAAFSTRVPGCYLFLGVRNEARDIVHMIHTPEFDVDEACLPLGVASLSEAIIRMAREWTPLT